MLFENKATYPLKINLTTPQHLSIEALEIHYRIHASILKYLELHEGKPISRATGKVFQKYLKESDNGLFSNPTNLLESDQIPEVGTKRLAIEDETLSIKRRKLSDLTLFEDVANIMEDMLKTLELEKCEKKQKPEDDVVMIIDSDDDLTVVNKRMQSYKDISKKALNQLDTKSNIGNPVVDSDSSKQPKIRVKNAQEIMDDMMKKCMANQTEYKSETETDIEYESDKAKDFTKTDIPEKTQVKRYNIVISIS